MERGYSIVKKEETIVNDAGSLKVGDQVSVRLFKGEFISEVKKIKK
jgi:exonuclease VII large subunit